MKRMSKSTLLDRAQVLYLVARINVGEITPRDALGQLTNVLDGRPIRISEQTFRDYCRAQEITIQHSPPGRRSIEPPSDVTTFIKQTYASAPHGSTIMHSICAHEGFHVSDYRVQQVYRENDLFKFHRSALPPPIPRTRYAACQRDLIWHTDLHYVDFAGESRQYLIAFLDDASRFLVNWSLLTEKSAAATTEFLEDIMTFGSTVPYCIWSDNGGEFTGRTFQEALRKYHIILKTTQVHTPQQNGKIERFWQNVEEAQDRDQLNRILDEYNYRPHTGLPKVRLMGKLVYPRPVDKYVDLPSWQEGRRTWTVDGEEKDFK
jgi:transposase InsO family protein